MVTEFDKAIVGVITPLIVFILLKFGFNVDPNYSALLASALTGIVVYLTPNKK